jgi:TrbB protein
MKDTIFQTGDTLLTHFAATGVTKRITSVKLDAGYSFQLDSAGTGVEFVTAGREPGLVESFGTHELAATALHNLRNKVVAGARLNRARLIMRGGIWFFVAAVLLVFVLSLNTIATSLLVRGSTVFNGAASVPVEHVAPDRPVTPQLESKAVPPASELAEALAAGEASGKYTVGLSDGSEGTLYVFSDPSCPHCRRLEGALTAIQGKVKVVVFPVTVFGGERSKTLLDQVFCAVGDERRSRWDAAIDLKGGDAEGCSGAGDAALDANNEFFQAIGFEGTPSIINGSGRVFPTNRAASADNLLAWAKAE